MVTIHQLLDEVDRLPATDKWRLVNYVLRSLEQIQVQPQSDWHEAVLATYGILVDDPIECPEQLPLEERDSIE